MMTALFALLALAALASFSSQVTGNTSQGGTTSLTDRMSIAVMRSGDRTEEVKLLLAEGADVNAMCDKYGKTPLLWAVMGFNPGMVTLLLDNGADIEAKDDNGMTPLMLAIQCSQLEMVRILLAKGADVNIRACYDLLTPLKVAVKFSKSLEIVRLLIGNGADLYAKDKFGRADDIRNVATDVSAAADEEDEIVADHIRQYLCQSIG